MLFDLYMIIAHQLLLAHFCEVKKTASREAA